MIRINDPDIQPLPFVNFMFEDFFTKKIQKLRFVSRIYPVENTCFATEEDLAATVEPLVLRDLGGSEPRKVYTH